MGIRETVLIYLILGAVVAVALVIRAEQAAFPQRLGLMLGGLVFWPLFASVLLGSEAPRRDPADSSRLARVQQSLLDGLERLRGLAEEVLAPEIARVRGLADAVHAMEHRLTEMEQILATPEMDRRAAESALTALSARGVPEGDPRLQSVAARLRNIDRLRAMRARTSDDIERVLLKMEEMSTQLRLLAFAGRPDAEVVEAIKDIAASVDGIAEGLIAAHEAA